MTTTLTLKVPREMAAKLEAVAGKKRVPKSKYFRDVLSVALNKEKEEPNLLELMKDAIGCFEGPSDLSTNPKHMKATESSAHNIDTGPLISLFHGKNEISVLPIVAVGITFPI